MILGLGIDIVDLESFGGQLRDQASLFLRETFTPRERSAAENRRDPVLYLAGRFAAKEAFVKAWSAIRWGLSPLLKKLPLGSIEILSDQYGRPKLNISEPILQALEPLSPYRLHVSISHDGGYTVATVIIESI